METPNRGTCLILIGYVLFLSSLQEPVSGGQEGFISIDCGKTYTYHDKKTDLKYVPDTNFIDSGENNQISSYFRGVLDGNADYAQSYNLRSFPNGTRNCYTLRPVIKGSKYLLRAFFKYGNYDGKDILPRFDLYLGENLWFHVQIVNSSRNSYTEIIAVAPANSISVCLLNRNTGVPFISSLELRPLNDSLYREVDTSSSLVLRSTLDCGETGDIQIRYPDDSYDRLWNTYLRYNWTSIRTTSDSFDATMSEYQPPSKVMKTAAIPKSGFELDFYSDLEKFEWSKDAVGPPKHYIFLHFAELESLGINDSRIFNVKLNDEVIGYNVTPKYMSTTTITNGKPRNYDKISLSIYSVAGSTLPPILNSLRIYISKQLNEKNTHSQDVDAIMDIKYEYKVKMDWMGDPCFPLELRWKGLTCSNEITKSPRIISLNLSSRGLSGKLIESVADLTELEQLDLSINNLEGEIPDFLANLAHLYFLNLTGSGLHGPIPPALQHKLEKGLLTLSFEGFRNSANSKKTVVIVVGSVVSVSFLLFMVLIFVWRRKNKKKDLESSKRYSSSPSAVLLNQNNDGLHFQLKSRKFSYGELIGITNNFRKVLGKGGFGTVYHGVMENGDGVAVKVLSKLSSQGPKEFQNEAQLLTRIHHRNLVPLVGYCYDKDHLALVYERMEEGTLESHLSGTSGRTTVFSWRERLKIALGAAQGLEYLHKGCKPVIVHRDVKTSNILLDRKMEARISDFGLSKIFEEDGITHITTAIMGTRGYLDPEYNITNKLNEKSDVYSFGIVLLELITGKPAIIRSTFEPIHIIDWVQPGVEHGDLYAIVDHKLGDLYNVNSIWKVLEAALACTRSRSFERITMSEVVFLLKECFELETDNDNTVHSVSHGNSSNSIGNSMKNYDTTIETISTDTTMITDPPARLVDGRGKERLD